MARYQVTFDSEGGNDRCAVGELLSKLAARFPDSYFKMTDGGPWCYVLDTDAEAFKGTFHTVNGSFEIISDIEEAPAARKEEKPAAKQIPLARYAPWLNPELIEEPAEEAA